MLNLPPIIIPSLQPEPKILSLIDGLISSGFNKIVVVDDGSSEDRDLIFKEIKNKSGVTLLRHAVNLGKGASLKMAMNNILVSDPSVTGVITVDGDGQHSVKDVVKLAKAMGENPSTLILGARSFSEDVPMRSRFGNLVTKWVFHFLVGKNLTDTQTGLRAIPKALIKELLALPSNRYEFELDMLIVACKKSFPVSEVPISTIYEDGNKSSHFNPFLDSFRIYFVFLRFVSLSLVIYGTDLFIFSLSYRFSGRMFASIFFGRFAGLIVGIVGSRRFVFKSDKKVIEVVLKLLTLWVFLLGISYGLMIVLVEKAHLNVYASRVLVDSTLFIINFLIQRDIVFGDSGKAFLKKIGFKAEYEANYEAN